MDKKGTFELSAEEIAAIHAYLYDELTAAERETFERRMDTESGWRDKVEEVKLLVLGIKEANLSRDLDAWKEQLIFPENAGTSLPNRPSIPLYRQWWVAASLILLAVGAMWIMWRQGNTAERLYQAYYEQDIGLPIEMSASEESRYRFYDGMVSYKEGNYPDALEKWKDVGDEMLQSDTLGYYRAVAYMGMADVAAAAGLLIGIASDDRSAFHSDAVWYLALCYLRQDDIDASTTWLKTIPHDHRAQQLLDQLEKL